MIITEIESLKTKEGMRVMREIIFQEGKIMITIIIAKTIINIQIGIIIEMVVAAHQQETETGKSKTETEVIITGIAKTITINITTITILENVMSVTTDGITNKEEKKTKTTSEEKNKVRTETATISRAAIDQEAMQFKEIGKIAETIEIITRPAGVIVIKANIGKIVDHLIQDQIYGTVLKRNKEIRIKCHRTIDHHHRAK